MRSFFAYANLARTPAHMSVMLNIAPNKHSTALPALFEPRQRRAETPDLGRICVTDNLQKQGPVNVLTGGRPWPEGS